MVRGRRLDELKDELQPRVAQTTRYELSEWLRHKTERIRTFDTVTQHLWCRRTQTTLRIVLGHPAA